MKSDVMDVIVSLKEKTILDNVSVVINTHTESTGEAFEALLHAFHKSLVSGATHRPVAMNFMDGTREQIERMISNQATGKVIPSFVLSISRQGVIFLVVIIVCVKLFAYDGVLMAQAVADVISALIAIALLFTQNIMMMEQSKTDS